MAHARQAEAPTAHAPALDQSIIYSPSDIPKIMAYLNKVMLIGNLTADPEVRDMPSGTPLTELRIAVSRLVGNRNGNEGERREETVFLDVSCWNRAAEIAAQFLAKGNPVFVEGRLQQDTWEDKQTGQRRSRIRVVADNIQLLQRRENNGQGGPQGGGYQQGGYQQRGNYGGGNYQRQGGYQQQRQGGYPQQGGYQQQAPAPAPQQAPAPQPQAPAPLPNEADDDIPF